MNKNITYNLDEARMRGLLEQFQTSFDEQHWLETEKNLDALGLQSKAKVSLNGKKIGIFATLVLLAGGLVAFINLNKSKKNDFKAVAADTRPENRQAFAGVNETTGIKVTNELPKLVLNRKPIEIQATEKSANVANVPANNVIAENIIPEKNVVAEVKEEKKPENSPVITVDTSKKDIVSADNQEVKTHKKKKRRKHSDNNAVTPNTHSAGEDDVIISE